MRRNSDTSRTVHSDSPDVVPAVPGAANGAPPGPCETDELPAGRGRSPRSIRGRRWAGVLVPSTAGRGRLAQLVGGLIPAALHVGDAELADALQTRERLVDARSDLVLERARLAGAPWLAALGAEPAEERSRRSWTAAARTVAAYRDRYHITDPTTPLGPGVGADRQRAAARDLAATAIATLRTGVDVDEPDFPRRSSEPPLAVERDRRIPTGR